MKKIGLLVSLLMLLLQLVFPSNVSAAGCDGFSPTTVKNSDDSVTFNVDNLSPNTDYQVKIDSKGVVGSHTVQTNDSGHLSAPFKRTDFTRGDAIFALEPQNFHEVSVTPATGGNPTCTSTYTVVSACKINFSGDDPSGPRNITTNTNITVTGESLPLAPKFGEIQFVKVSGTFIRSFNINIGNDKKFTTSIGKLETQGVYSLALYRRDVFNIADEKITSCDQQIINVGAPGKPADNPPGGNGGGFGPGGRPIVSCNGMNTNVDTAIGCIPVNTTQDFVAWFLGWFIGIAGGIAFLLMIFGGFQVMTASGNPDQAKGGQEIITAAISGLILIIFSVFLLKLIGVQIFQIPGLI